MFKKSFYIFLWLCVMSNPAYAAKLSIACAANFTSAMKELVALYEEQTHVECRSTFGSTGMLYGQITKGAPYDLFLAADEKRPRMLHDEGLARAPRLYARGKVILWSKDGALAGMDDWKSVVCCTDVKRVGIANPKIAPYGLRAVEAMASEKIYSKVEPKLAFGKSVGIAFQYAYAGAADVSFAALSQAVSAKGHQGTYWEIPQAGMINQAACVIDSGDTVEAAAFLNWMQTASAKAIIKKYGYE